MSIIIYICLFCLSVFCLVELIEYFYRKTNRFRKSLGDVEKFVQGVPKNIRILNIGSGPALYGIDYSGCDELGYNFSTAPQNLKYGFRIIKRYHRNICKSAIVIIVLLPMSFGNNADCNRLDYSDKYYYFLPWKEIDNFSIKKAICLSHPLTCRIIRKYKSLFVCFPNRKKNDSTKKNEIDYLKNESFESKELPIVKCWKSEFNLTDLKNSFQAKDHEIAFKEKKQILQKILDYCKKRAWRPVLLIPPIPDRTREFISSDFIEAFLYEHIKDIKKDNVELHLLDYYSDSSITNEMFMDDIFLNDIGKNAFSKKMFFDIKQLFKEGKND